MFISRIVGKLQENSEVKFDVVKEFTFGILYELKKERVRM